MTQGQRLGWTSAATLGVAGVGALLARWWVAVESRRAAPLMDLALLRRRTLALTNAAALCVGCGIFMAYVPLAAIAQAPRATGYGFGLSVAAAGALLIPHGVGQILAGPWTGGLCARIGSRATLIIGTSLNASMMAAITAFHGSPFSLLLAGGVLGLGQAFALTAMANLVVGAVAAGDVGIATGVNGVMRTVGMALGSAMSAAIVASGSASGLATDHAYAVASPSPWPPASPRAPRRAPWRSGARPPGSRGSRTPLRSSSPGRRARRGPPSLASELSPRRWRRCDEVLP